MGLRSKLARVQHTLKMMAVRGIADGAKTGLNRYQYDHTVSATLPTVCPTLPYHIQVEPSRTCNLRCKMCRYSYRDNPGTCLSLDMFKTILAQFPVSMSIDLTGLGEPFMNAEFLDLVQHAAQHGFQVWFNTNGYLLSEDKMDVLIAAGTKTVFFSIDAATAPTYAKIRIGSDFDRVMRVIEKFSEKVSATNRGKPDRYLTYTLSTTNIDEAWQFPALAAQVGATGVVFRDMISFPEVGFAQEARVESLGAEVLQDIAQRILAEARKHQIDVTLAPALEANRPKRLLCNVPWTYAFVDVNGYLYPCCRWMERHEGNAEYAWGNMLTDRFEDIWNNDAYQKLRAEIVDPTAIPAPCAGCELLIK